MIKIFNSNERDFSYNGLVNINPYYCEETKRKSLNGWYLDLQIDIKYKDYIIKDNLVVIKSKSKTNPQAFRLDNPKYRDNIIEVKANHVMFDAENYMLVDVRPTNLNALNALKWINERTDSISPFTYSSDIGEINTAYFIFKNLLEAWEIIESRWGGTFDADNWHITLSNNLGKDVGQMLVYQKNLKDFEKYEDWDNVVTTLYPTGPDGIKLPELFLKADIEYSMPYSKRVEFESDIESDEEISEEDLINELREKATKYLNENKVPKVSYETTANINEEYDINDKILVKHPLVDIKTEVQEYTYDHIKKKTKNLIFGNYTRDVKKKFQSIKENISKAADKASANSNLIKEQTDLINNKNKLGRLYINDNELFVLDTLPKENALNVVRLGLGGLGFSHTGIEGPFLYAFTQDGKINADFIQSGHINTDLIEGYKQLLLYVNKLVPVSNTITGTGSIQLENAYKGTLHHLEITGDIQLIYPSEDLYPSDDLYPLDTYLIVDDKKYHLDINCLNYISSDVCDKYIYQDGKQWIERYVGENDDGTLYQLEEPIIENKEDLIIEVSSNSIIKLESFDNANYSCTYLLDNEYTSSFATNVDLISQINMSPGKILINSSKLAKIGSEKIELEGYISANGNFFIDLQGNMYATNGTFSGNVYLPDGGKVIGGQGLLTNLVYNGYTRGSMITGTGDYLPLGRVGGGNTVDSQKNDLVFSIELPDNFTVISAKLYLSHAPINWNISGTNITGYSRNLKLYKANDLSNLKINMNPDSGAYYSTGISYTEISAALGSNGFTGSNSSSTNIESIELKDYIDQDKLNYLVVKDSIDTLYSSNNDIFGRTGGVFAYIEIIGYKAIESEE